MYLNRKQVAATRIEIFWDLYARSAAAPPVEAAPANASETSCTSRRESLTGTTTT